MIAWRVQRFVLMAIIVFGLLASSQHREVLASGRRAAELKPILEVLDKAAASASLEFSGSCEVDNFPQFPVIHESGIKKNDPVEALREMFDTDTVQVYRDQAGIIRIVEKGVQNDILDVRINRVSFENQNSGTQEAAYTPNDALRKILHAPELEDFIRTHSIGWDFAESGLIRGVGSRRNAEAPHISGSLNSTRLSKALDYILDTFPGLWIYEDCPAHAGRARMVYFRFYYLRTIGTSVFVDE